MNPFLQAARKLFPYTQSLRRDFHQHPELGFQEVRTAGIVARELNALGLEVSTGVGQTGVVALLEGERPGPVLMLRFDMDALPIQEETGAPYASQTPGVMHACGHDGHTAIGLTVARILHERRGQLAGKVKLVFQPAEELVDGARRMVADGVLANPSPDMALGLHLWNTKPLGWVGVTPGPAMSAADNFRLKLTGVGGHGAAPHLAVDPLVAAAQVISAAQSVVARNVSPLEAAVISFTQIHGGDTFNVIPPHVELSGTIRTFDSRVRERVLARFEEIVNHVSTAMGCQAALDHIVSAPAVVNDPELVARVQQVVQDVLPESDLSAQERTMGSEDMAVLMENVPGCYFFVGSANPEKHLDAPHHHPGFDFDEQALPRAVALMSAAAVTLLSS